MIVELGLTALSGGHMEVGARDGRAGHRRLGRARRLIADLLAESDGPLTADAVIAALPEIHPSSVYRSLNVLEELGYVRHVHLAHGAALYEVANRVSSVRHLVCEVCGQTVAVPLKVLDPLRKRLEREFGFVLDSTHFAITGRCSTCER
jgi:Fur family transcriptional regulator, ferric uptake regulator